MSCKSLLMKRIWRISSGNAEVFRSCSRNWRKQCENGQHLGAKNTCDRCRLLPSQNHIRPSRLSCLAKKKPGNFEAKMFTNALSTNPWFDTWIAIDRHSRDNLSSVDQLIIIILPTIRRLGSRCGTDDTLKLGLLSCVCQRKSRWTLRSQSINVSCWRSKW